MPRADLLYQELQSKEDEWSFPVFLFEGKLQLGVRRKQKYPVGFVQRKELLPHTSRQLE